jgi:N-acetylneuraminic acid mutarotase
MKKNRAAQSAFFNQSALFAFLLSAAAACSLVSRPLLAFFHPEAPAKTSHPAAAGLTFAKRVAYQRAIEEVYWQHRIWPKENSKPKPSLDEVMSAAQIEKKVEDYLRDSQALEVYSQRTITAEQLQAEMERMARNTKQPEVLRELFEALGNDPFVIAECLVRSVITKRLIRDLMNGRDPAIAGDRPLFLKHDSARPAVAPYQNATTLAINLGKATYTLPEIDPCTDDTWTATSTTNAPEARARHAAVWTGSEMIVWGGIGTGDLNTGGRYNPSTDSWAATGTTNAPDGRYYHTAVWTGSEMIVWGGYNGSSYVNTGGRYNPSTDSWTVTSTTNAPEARYLHTAVWTGSEMIIWGGYGTSDFFNTGGRYNPSTNGWTATSTTNAPEARAQHHPAVWTGSEMIVWGGSFFDGTNYHYFNTGGRYNPSTDSWIATNTTNAPEGRDAHTPVWTGSEMIIWGGGYPVLNTGGRYNPATDSWAATSTTNAPVARYLHRAVWTGSEMIVWGGGNGSSAFNTGGRYNPSTDTWTGTGTTNAPNARLQHTAVWTGSEMVVWGGNFNSNTGGRYCAQSGAPSPTPTPTATSMPCHVSSAACGGVITGTAPTDFILNVSDPVDPATVDPTDFTVNGIPADAFALQNGNMTIVFHFNTTPVTQGLNTMHIPAGAFNCVNGPVAEFTCAFTYEASTPTPTPTATLSPSPTPTPTATPIVRATPIPRLRPTPPPRP